MSAPGHTDADSLWTIGDQLDTDTAEYSLHIVTIKVSNWHKNNLFFFPFLLPLCSFLSSSFCASTRFCLFSCSCFNFCLLFSFILCCCYSLFFFLPSCSLRLSSFSFHPPFLSLLPPLFPLLPPLLPLHHSFLQPPSPIFVHSCPT